MGQVGWPVFTCDHCGKIIPAVMHNDKPVRPEGMLHLHTPHGIFDACTIECAKAINQKLGVDSHINEKKPQ